MPLDLCGCLRRRNNSTLAQFELELLTKVRLYIETCSRLKNENRYGEEHYDLIVEDNQTNARVLSEVLKKYGRKCKVASNGYIALDYISSKKVDIIWTDIRMSTMDGITFTKIARDKYPHGLGYTGRIIGVTAYADPDTFLACMKAGMDGIVTKPYKKEDISIHLSDDIPVPERAPVF